ncbi:MAG TPA: NAD(P)-binding domain-containing protein [Rhizomicrobium sp.]|nr:NAD(P)-binding domain-containing protein [Rhizomicrobium sp.]
MIETVIIGAGPYGLSLAAHLSAMGAPFRIFGKPLETWRAHVPKGMLLKSDGFASNLSSPDPDSTLKVWCEARGKAYDDTAIPVPLADFLDYSAWFQQRYVPTLEDSQVVSLARAAHGGFTLWLDNGEMLQAARVVLAVGISWFKHMPDELRELPPSLVSHSYDHHDLAGFAGRKLLMLGAGSSAVDTAVLAREAGADVSLLARASQIHYHTPPDPDAVSWLKAIAHPSSGIGPGWRSFLCARAPRLFRRMPERLRLRATSRHLGPAPGWFMRGKLQGKTLLGHEIENIRPYQDGVLVTARNGDGGTAQILADHVIAATGYRPDLRRLPFLVSELREQIAHVRHTPHLSDYFETSAPGLYAVGPLAANAFGPLMRFMVGAEYAAPRLAAHLVKTAAKLRAVA